MQLGVDRVQASRWRERYAQARLAGIERDLPRGAPPTTVDVARLVELTTQAKPEAATHWSTRTMAAELGISAASVSRYWRKNGLKPHVVRRFKVSRDPKCVEKLEDIVGLYMSPPEHALMLCCDEKSQVQALDRTQPGLPLKKGVRHHDARLQAQRHNHAVRRAQRSRWPGHLPVPAAPSPHRVAEVLLRQIDRETPQDRALHLIADNYATHRRPVVQEWLAQASALRHALHAHLGIVAEYGRALLPRYHRQAAAPRRVHQRAGSGDGHRRIHRSPQHQPQAVHLNQDCSRHPEKGHSGQ